MNHDLSISQIQVRLVENGTDGLIAWASCIVSHAIKLDNLGIRRGRDGSLFITYPAKRTAAGNSHQYFHPISADATQAIENAVLTQLAALAKAAGAGLPKGTQAP